MGSKTAKSPTQPIANFVEKQRQELLSRREEIIANWREKGDNLENLFRLSKIDREAACLVEQVINGDGWQASYLAREVIRSGFNQKCTTYWRAIGATLRWIARTRQTYDIHKFLGPLLLYRHHLLPSERNDLFELAAKHLPVNLFWGKDGRDISLDVLIDGKMTDAIPAFKKLLLRDESSQQISMHEALLQGRNNQRLMVLLQLLAIQAEEKRLNRRSEAQSA